MNREELSALHAAIGTVLTWPAPVLEQMARWLAPVAAKSGNGLDAHPPPVAPTGEGVSPRQAAPAPHAGKARRGRPKTSAKPAEQRLLEAMGANPGSTVAALAIAADAGRSVTGERLRQLARRGAVGKDHEGHWRLAEETEARPTEAP